MDIFKVFYSQPLLHPYLLDSLISNLNGKPSFRTPNQRKRRKLERQLGHKVRR